MHLLRLDERETAHRLETFLRTKLAESRAKGFVLGLSGGIDSALAAAIAAKAVAPDKILGIIMPYKQSSEKSETDALLLAERLRMKTRKIPISPMIDAYFPDIKTVESVRAGNKMARERMSILFDVAHENNLLVLGTSNRTEICLGYGTWYGDVACSVNPLGMLFKTQVRQMAKFYDIPEEILFKIPTADLWPGQTDEKELGLEYAIVDRLLYFMIEKGMTERAQLNKAGFENSFIDRTVYLLNKYYFKRHLPAMADIGLNPIPDKIEIT